MDLVAALALGFLIYKTSGVFLLLSCALLLIFGNGSMGGMSLFISLLYYMFVGCLVVVVVVMFFSALPPLSSLSLYSSSSSSFSLQLR